MLAIPSITGSVLAPFMPYIIGGALAAAIGGGFWLHDRWKTEGVQEERAAWQAGANATAAAYAAAAVDAEQLRRRMYANVNTAADRAVIGSKTYYESRPVERDAECLPVDRVRAINAARHDIAAAAGGSISSEADPDPGAPIDLLDQAGSGSGVDR